VQIFAKTTDIYKCSSKVYSASLLREKIEPLVQITGFLQALFWELPPNLNWEILSTFLSTKYESEMNNNFSLGAKQQSFSCSEEYSIIL
jgi:hypothetical protein